MPFLVEHRATPLAVSQELATEVDLLAKPPEVTPHAPRIRPSADDILLIFTPPTPRPKPKR